MRRKKETYGTGKTVNSISPNLLPNNFVNGKQSDLFASLDEVAVYITDHKAKTLAVTKTYESLTGLDVEDLLGRNMKDIEDAGLIDKSVTLLSLMHNCTITIDQKILPTGKKILVTSNPVFNQAGEVVLVTSLLYPWNTRGLKDAESKEGVHVTSLPVVHGMVFTSSVMQQVLTRAVKAASTNSTILISGESGVGKEVLAKIIHQLSPRKGKPFITVNMTNIPEELFESELFGYKRGAFTGALDTGRAGLVEAAAGGTLFLDEISEIPLNCQAKLLRLLQEKEVLPIGGAKSKRVDVRFLAATNRDLESLIISGKFREDLYYRLNAIPIYIPPLRERRRLYRTRKYLTSTALQVLLDYPWPGNVREILNIVDRLFVIHPQEEVDGTMIVDEIFLDRHRSSDRSEALLSEGLQETVGNFEKELIESVLRKCNGDLDKAAKILRVHRTTLFRKLQKYRLKRLPSSNF